MVEQRPGRTRNDPRIETDPARDGGGRRGRRRFLRCCGALGLTTLGGCTARLRVDDGTVDARTGGTPDAAPTDVAPAPALYIYSEEYDEVYTSDVLDAYDGDVVPGRPDSDHVDTDAFATTLTDDAFTVEFTGVVTRPVTVAVNLTSSGLPYDDRGPSFPAENPVDLAAPLDATGTAAAPGTGRPRDRLETHGVSFDLGAVDLPRNVGIHADVCLQDPLTDSLRMLAHHGALPLAYTIDGEERLRWLEEPGVVEGGEPRLDEADAHYHASFEEAGHRVSYGVGGWNGRRWAVGVALDVEEMEHYADHGDTGWFPHALEAANTAHTDPVMRRFARRFSDALDAAGVADPLDRLDALADYVQTIPYRIPEDGDRKPAYTLYSQTGDCSEKTFLFGGVLRCEPWTTRLGYVYCYRDGVNHTVPAIHLDELRDSDRPPDSLYTIRPGDLPRTPDGHRHDDEEFVFVEVTADRDRQIGEFDPDTYDLEYFYGTNFWSAHEW